MLKTVVKYIAIFFLASLSSCGNDNFKKFNAKDACSNFHLSIGVIFSEEVVSLYLNDELVFRSTKDAMNRYRLIENFCFKYKERNIVRIISEYNSKKLIMEEYHFNDQNLGYQLAVSFPYPKNWRELFKQKNYDKSSAWKNLTLNSSVRFINFYADTVSLSRDNFPKTNLREN